jgi:hypothetical protein
LPERISFCSVAAHRLGRCHKAVRVQGDRINAGFHQKGCEVRIIARGLTAYPHLGAAPVRASDHIDDHALDRSIAFIEQIGEFGRVPIHAQYQLRQVIAADRDAIEAAREFFGENDVGGNFAHDIDLPQDFSMIGHRRSSGSRPLNTTYLSGLTVPCIRRARRIVGDCGSFCGFFSVMD